MRLSEIQHNLLGDCSELLLGVAAVCFVDQMPVLRRDAFSAVLDLKNPTGMRAAVIDVNDIYRHNSKK